MTVKELIELNQMITDVVITVRDNGCTLLDQLNFGPSCGEKPPYPTRVPTKAEYAGNLSDALRKDAAYIPKSVNSWDDGKDYWQVKPNRIPKAWLDLTVFSWGVRAASTVCYSSPRRHNGGLFFKNVSFHGEQINITALPSGQSLAIKEPKEVKPDEQIDGQMSIEDWNIDEVVI